MDIDLLRYYLKDKYTYQEATKEVFLDKIERIFEVFRKAGDKELWMYEGVCAGADCPNCGKKGYRLVGNHSKNYLNLIFELNGDEITDIYSCSQFKSDIEVPDLGEKSSIDIDRDETANFPKPASYWIRVNAAQGAYNEIVTQPPRKLSFEEIESWLGRYAGLYERLGGFRLLLRPLKWSPFLFLYYKLNEIAEVVSPNLDKISQANREYNENWTEQKLIDWVVAYEEIYHIGTLEMKYFLVKDGEDYAFSEFDKYLFAGEVFSEVYSFFKAMCKHYYELLAKYTIYTGDEEDQIAKEDDWKEKIHEYDLLGFHMKKRKELEELGIHLPFYLRNEDKQTDSIDVPF